MKLGDLRIYDKDFNLIEILPRYLSVNWEIKFKEYGLGEIELEKTDNLVSLLIENKYLFVFQDDIQSIVTGYKIGETITIYTRTLEWLLTKFVVGDFTVEKLMEKVYGAIWSRSRLIEYLLASNLHEDYNILFSGIESDDSDMTEFVFKNADTLYSAICSAINDDRIGFKFYRDMQNERFVFRLLSANERDDILLCDEYKTTYESEYNFDLQKDATGGIYYHDIKNMGKWKANTNTPDLSPKDENYGKYYTVSAAGSYMGENYEEGDIILCKNKDGTFEKIEEAKAFAAKIPPEENGIFSWSGVLNSRDEESARQEISGLKALDMLTCKTRLSYKEDFNLGDIVRVKLFGTDRSFEKTKLISEIHIWEEEDETGAMPTTIDIS